MVNILLKHLITDSVDVSLQGNANGKQLNSTTTVKINLFPDSFEVGSGPLKSTDKLSNGWVAFINVPGDGLKNLGFNSQQVGHDLQTVSTSFNEYGRFLILTW